MARRYSLGTILDGAIRVLDWTSRPEQDPWQPEGDREPEAWRSPSPGGCRRETGVRQGGPPPSSRGTDSPERAFVLTMRLGAVLAAILIFWPQGLVGILSLARLRG